MKDNASLNNLPSRTGKNGKKQVKYKGKWYAPAMVTSMMSKGAGSGGSKSKAGKKKKSGSKKKSGNPWASKK